MPPHKLPLLTLCPPTLAPPPHMGGQKSPLPMSKRSRENPAFIKIILMFSIANFT